MRLRVDAFPTSPDWAHFTLVEATGTSSAEDNSNDQLVGRVLPSRNSRRSQWRCSAAGLNASVSDMVKPWMVPG